MTRVVAKLSVALMRNFAETMIDRHLCFFAANMTFKTAVSLDVAQRLG
jgi:hypothetical protein